MSWVCWWIAAPCASTPAYLDLSEFHAEPRTFGYHDVSGERREIELPAHALAFTCCQVPFVYRLVDEAGWVRTVDTAGARRELRRLEVDEDVCREIFGRTGQVARVEVGIPRN